MAISVVGFGSAQGAGGSINVPWPSGHQADDIGILVVETSGNNASPPTPSGWSLVATNFDVSTTSGSDLDIFWRRATSSGESSVTINDTGNHQLGRIFALRGCVASGSPIHVVATSKKITLTSSSTVPAITTTVANTYYAAVVSHPIDTAADVFGTPSNSSLTFSDVQQSSTIAGNGGGFIIALAPKSSTGSSGTTSISQSPSSTNAITVFALEPAGATVLTLTADAGSFTLSGQDAALSFTRAVISESGSFTTTGQAAALLQAKRLSSEAGTFALTGQQAALRVSRRLTTQAGSFTLTGQPATLQATRSLTTQAGSFTLTGQSATLQATRSLTTQAGTFTLTGQSAVLVRARSITAQAGSFTLTGQNVVFLRNGLGVVAFGAQTTSTIAVNVSWPTGHQAGDIGVLVVERSGNDNPVNISGWNLAVSTYDVLTTAGSRLQIYWKRATSSSEPFVSTGDGGDHQLARIFVIRGCYAQGNPLAAIGYGGTATASTTATVGSITTAVPRTLYAAIASRPNDSSSTTQFGGPSNSNLSFIEDQEAGSSNGNGGGFVIALAPWASAGPTGDTTFTQTASTTNAWAALAFTTTPVLISEPGAFAITGQDVTFSKPDGSGNYTLTGNTSKVWYRRNSVLIG